MTEAPRYGATGSGEAPVCPRHPDRVSYVRCQRCGRPVCPECQRPAAVGVLCVDCARQAAVKQPRVKRTTAATPVITYAIMAICVVVYLGQLASSAFENRFVFYAPLIPEEIWRLLTSGFLHDSHDVISIHLVMNMLSLWFLGRVLEPHLGRWRFASVFLLGVIGGNAAMGLLNWSAPALGASGGIFALGGALLIALRKDRNNLISMAVILGINFAYGFMRSGIAWEAHLGGLLVGVLLGLIYEIGRRKALISPAGAKSVATTHLVITLVLLVALVGLGYYGGERATDLYFRTYYGVG
ncbi:MAG: rhomboid family intramembrane serine protease [Galactobacter sp.]